MTGSSFHENILMWTLKYTRLVFVDTYHAAIEKKLRNDPIFTCGGLCALLGMAAMLIPLWFCSDFCSVLPLLVLVAF